MSASAWGLLALFLGVLGLAAWPLGMWLARICSGRLPNWMHAVEAPLMVSAPRIHWSGSCQKLSHSFVAGFFCRHGSVDPRQAKVHTCAMGHTKVTVFTARFVRLPTCCKGTIQRIKVERGI